MQYCHLQDDVRHAERQDGHRRGVRRGHRDVDHGGDPAKLVYEVADLWFHSMIALAHYGLKPADVVDELARREGLSGLEEKALRKAQDREAVGE